MTTTLTGKNQVTVPAEIVQKLGLTPGTLFDWELSEDCKQIIIRIKPSRSELLRRLEEIARGSHRPGSKPVDGLLNQPVPDQTEGKRPE